MHILALVQVAGLAGKRPQRMCLSDGFAKFLPGGTAHSVVDQVKALDRWTHLNLFDKARHYIDV